MESPIRGIRTTLGLTQRELAVAAGIKGPAIICEVENGLRPLGGRLLDLLERTEFNVDKITRQQEEFMEWKKADVIARLSGEAHRADE